EGIYSLGASEKDDLNRIPNFVEKHKKGGKFNHDNIDACYPPHIDILSINNKNISATNIRDSIKNNNFELFKSYYINIKESIILELYNYLKTIICQEQQAI
ncbi:MAG: hypothetical protein RSC92_04815, partial [Clostridia bacterium]